jgi:hypothetical protein
VNGCGVIRGVTMTIYIIDFANALFPSNIVNANNSSIAAITGEDPDALYESLLQYHKPWLDQLKPSDRVVPMLNTSRDVFRYSSNFSTNSYSASKLVCVSVHRFFQFLKTRKSVNLIDPLALLKEEANTEIPYLYQNVLIPGHYEWTKKFNNDFKFESFVSGSGNKVLREEYIDYIVDHISRESSDENIEEIILIDSIGGVGLKGEMLHDDPIDLPAGVSRKKIVSHQNDKRTIEALDFKLKSKGELSQQLKTPLLFSAKKTIEAVDCKLKSNSNSKSTAFIVAGAGVGMIGLGCLSLLFPVVGAAVFASCLAKVLSVVAAVVVGGCVANKWHSSSLPETSNDLLDGSEEKEKGGDLHLVKNRAVY